MTLKQNICDILKESGFYLKSTPDYRVQIFVKENVLVIVEEKEYGRDK